MKKLILLMMIVSWPAFGAYMPPGGISGQVQFNNNGSFGALKTFYVQAYGAVCDGAIVNGLQVTSGSPTVTVVSTTPTPNQYTDYTFTQADVGKTITINAGQFNTPGIPTNYFTSTIQSVSNGVVTLSSNSTFTSSGYNYATARLYKTDNKVSIQAALDAAHAVGGGDVIFPSGVCATSGPLTFYSNQHIRGSGPSATWILLAANSNSDMFVGQYFSSLTGTGAGSGMVSFVFQDLGLDGNKFANTGSGSGTASGYGDGIKLYGSNFYVQRLYISNFASDGWYSEWNDGAGDSLSSNVSLNARMQDVSFSDNNGWGIVWDGPHDSFIEDGDFINNTTGGLLEYGYHQLNAHSNGGPLNMNNLHGYQNGLDSTLGGGTSCERCLFEGTTILNSINYGFTDSALGTLQMGTATSTSIYGLTMVNTSVGTLNNTYNAGGGGFNDIWTGGNVSTITGSYSPNYSSAVKGLPSYVGRYGTSLVLQNNTSWPVNMSTNGGSQFSLQNGGQNALIINSTQQAAIGPAVSSVTAGTSLDLSSNTTTANSSLLLPVGTTGTRPTTGVNGMLRYNSTTSGIEAYANGSWLSLGSGPGVRAFNTGTTSDTVAAGVLSTYESANSASITLTLAAPNGDGETRRVCFKNAATVTWSVISPATAVLGLPTSVSAGQCVGTIYNATSGTPANAPATTWIVY